MNEPPPPHLAAVFLDVDGVIDSKKIGYLDETKVERLRARPGARPHACTFRFKTRAVGVGLPKSED